MPELLKPVIFIVAGHGGINPANGQYTTNGKRASHSGIKLHDKSTFFEGVGNRHAALYLAAACIENGIVPILVHDDFADLSLSKRANKIKQIYSTLPPYVRARCAVIELHSDAATTADARGAATFTTTGNTRSDILAAFLLTEFDALQQTVSGFQVRRNSTTYLSGDYEKNFAIITAAPCPAVLIEMGFFTNTDDVKLLIDGSFYRQLAQSITHAFLSFIV